MKLFYDDGEEIIVGDLCMNTAHNNSFELYYVTRIDQEKKELAYRVLWGHKEVVHNWEKEKSFHKLKSGLGIRTGAGKLILRQDQWEKILEKLLAKEVPNLETEVKQELIEEWTKV